MPAQALPPLPGRRPAPARQQRGAIGLFAALTLMLAFVFAALSIDSGRLWLERRALQRTADMAALEAARKTWCGSTERDALTAATNAAARNGLVAQAGQPSPVALVRGRVKTDATTHQRQFTPAPAEDDGTDAVHVVVSKTVPSSMILRALSAQQVTLQAEAVAQGRPPITAFTLGSAFFSIDSSKGTLINGLLGGLLGSQLNLSVLSYQGLAAASLDLAHLLSLGVGAGTTDDLLSLDMGLGDALDLLGRAASDNGALSPDAHLGLTQLIQAAGLAGRTLKLGDLLSMNASNAPPGIQLNLLTMISLAIQVSAQDKAFDLPISLPGVAKVELKLGAVPAVALGPAGRSSHPDQHWCTEARTASGELSVQIDALDTLSALIQAVSATLVKPEMDFALKVKIGPAAAHATRIDVAPETAHVVMGADTGMVAVFICSKSDETKPARISVKLFGMEVVGLEIHLGTSQTGGAKDLDIAIPTPVKDHLPSDPAMLSNGTAGVVESLIGSGKDIVITPKVLGLPLPLGGILGAILKGLLPILSTLVDPLLALIGVQPGSATVQILELQSTQPQLVI